MNEKSFENYKEELLKIINELLPNCKIYLFGSRARNNHSPGADIDLALDNNSKIPLKLLFKLQDKIENSTIPLEVDLVDFSSATPHLKQIIKEEGIVWKV